MMVRSSTAFELTCQAQAMPVPTFRLDSKGVGVFFSAAHGFVHQTGRGYELQPFTLPVKPSCAHTYLLVITEKKAVSSSSYLSYCIKTRIIWT
jgi:hypothetical protein